MQLLLRALIIPGEIATNAVRLLLRDDRRWFLEDRVRPVLLRTSVWTCISRVVLEAKDSELDSCYLSRGHQLCVFPDWYPDLQQELATWILVFRRMSAASWRSINDYKTVLAKTWYSGPGDEPLTNMTSEETVLALTCVGLSKSWQELDLAATGSLGKVIPRLWCTTWTVLQSTYINDTSRITEDFKASVFIPLQGSLAEAAEAIRSLSESSPSPSAQGGLRRAQIIEAVIQILEQLANEVPTPGGAEKDWDELRNSFTIKIDELGDGGRLAFT